MAAPSGYGSTSLAKAASSDPITNEHLASSSPPNTQKVYDMQIATDTTIPRDGTIVGGYLSSDHIDGSPTVSLQFKVADHDILESFVKFVDGTDGDNQDALAMGGRTQDLQRLIKYTQSLEDLVKNIVIADYATVDRLHHGKEAGTFNPQWEIQPTLSEYRLPSQNDPEDVPKGLLQTTNYSTLPSYLNFAGFSQFQVPQTSPSAPKATSQLPGLGTNTDTRATSSTKKIPESDGITGAASNIEQKKRGRGRPPKKRAIEASQSPPLALAEEREDEQSASKRHCADGLNCVKKLVAVSDAHTKTSTSDENGMGPFIAMNINHDNEDGGVIDSAASHNSANGIPVKRGRGRPKKVK